MSKPLTYEMGVLNEISALIDNLNEKYLGKFECKLQILENISSHISGFCYENYNEIFGIQQLIDTEEIKKSVIKIANLMATIEIDPSLALAALAREPIDEEQQRKTGAFYTDFRLANFVAEECYETLKSKSMVADIASGTGILLAALATRYKKIYPNNFNKWLAECVYAFDLSDNALRGARIALSALTDNLESLLEMVSKWKNVDTLITRQIANNTFDIIVGNPPWGKIKLSRHNFVQGSGIPHVYGDEFEDFDSQKFISEKEKLSQYVVKLKKKYSILNKVEPDMYMAFLQKALFAVRRGGKICMLVPAGLIRSKGTTELREYLINECEQLEYTLINNKARFFTIDTRFKFLLLNLKTNVENTKLIKESLCYGECKKNNVIKGEPIFFDIDELKGARPDLTIPEVRNIWEKELYFRIYSNGLILNNLPIESEWVPTLTREIDMTNSRKYFLKNTKIDAIPVIEGRMIQPFHFGAKQYISGAGRSAVWENLISRNKVFPQFKIRKEHISENILELIKTRRAGYCDIAGQTNERGMMTAIVPSNVICGNKVPTVSFPNDSTGQMIYLWVAITNSFVYDWLLRRIISTTANYFLILSIPMPNIRYDSNSAYELIKRSRNLCDINVQEIADLKKIAIDRAEIDVMVAKAYGLTFEDLKLVLEDFPILDRKQPPIPGEKKSTVTKDFLLSVAEKEYVAGNYYSKRYEIEEEIGALPYIPTEMVDAVMGGISNGK